jgi:hypothetical protein
MFNSSSSSIIINKSIIKETIYNYDVIAPIVASIIILCINVLIIGLFLTFIYTMCTLTPIVHIFIEINKQIIHLMEHVNWINVITTTVSIVILLIFMYNIKNMTDEIDTLFEKLTGEISIKDAKIRQLENALQNATEKWIVGKQM